MKHHYSQVSQTPCEDTDAKIPLQAHDVYGNEVSFGFHLLAQGLFWVPLGFGKLDESKKSVTAIQHWEQIKQHASCPPDLSQTSNTIHTMSHMPMFIARYLHQGKNTVFQVQSIFHLPLKALWLKISFNCFNVL